MSKFDWKKTLGVVAPALASAFGGPMAGVAVKMAGDALGLSNASESDIEAAIAGGNPEVLLKLKNADHQFKVEMKSLDVDIERVHASDRASARALAMAKGFNPQMVLSALFVAGFIYVLGLLFVGKGELDVAMMQPAMYLLGILSAGIIQIMNFWFGSSAGSKQKADQMAVLLDREVK